MSIHKPVSKRGVYFITFTCFNWYPLIGFTSSYDLVYNFFDVLKQNGNEVLGFVIMPNHVHFLVHYTNTKQSLNTTIGNGKRFIGYGIVKRLEEKNELAPCYGAGPQEETPGGREKDESIGKLRNVAERIKKGDSSSEGWGQVPQDPLEKASPSKPFSVLKSNTIFM